MTYALKNQARTPLESRGCDKTILWKLLRNILYNSEALAAKIFKK